MHNFLNICNFHTIIFLEKTLIRSSWLLQLVSVCCSVWISDTLFWVLCCTLKQTSLLKIIRSGRLAFYSISLLSETNTQIFTLNKRYRIRYRKDTEYKQGFKENLKTVLHIFKVKIQYFYWFSIKGWQAPARGLKASASVRLRQTA